MKIVNFDALFSEDDVAASFANSDSMLEDSDSDGNARDGCGSPSTRRKKRLRKLRDSLKCRESASAEAASEETAYEDSLPEVSQKEFLVVFVETIKHPTPSKGMCIFCVGLWIILNSPLVIV